MSDKSKDVFTHTYGIELSIAEKPCCKWCGVHQSEMICNSDGVVRWDIFGKVSGDGYRCQNFLARTALNERGGES